jgi:hypothetical protein
MTKAVRLGLAHLSELGRCWLEADEDYDDEGNRSNGTLDDKERANVEKALAYVEAGGLDRPGDD